MPIEDLAKQHAQQKTTLLNRPTCWASDKCSRIVIDGVLSPAEGLEALALMKTEQGAQELSTLLHVFPRVSAVAEQYFNLTDISERDLQPALYSPKEHCELHYDDDLISAGAFLFGCSFGCLCNFHNSLSPGSTEFFKLKLKLS